jgi:CheY-specific phosphatase CheX
MKKILTFYEGLPMNDFQKDILTGTVFITGLLGFISGEFIISSTLFASAAIASNLNVNRKRGKIGQL